MTKYYCYECKTGNSDCKYPCVYIDPIGELHDADHITCRINDAKWIQEKCGCCGHDI